MKKYEIIGNRTIYLDEIYFLAYAGGSRELTKKNQENWDKTKNLPGLLQVKERNKLGMENNPNVVPLKGSMLISFIKERMFVPFFDRAFDTTKVVTLTDSKAYNHIKNNTFDYFGKQK